MIINMTGAGGAFSATLTITTNAGATITATCPSNGKTYTGTADENGLCVINIRAPGTYTITMTLNGETRTQTIVVSDTGENYIIERFQSLYLYNAGDTCDSVTGGYSNTVENYGKCTFGSAYITLDAVSNSVYSASASIRTKNKINVTLYDELVFTLSTTQTGNKLMTFSWGIAGVATGSIKTTSEKSQRIVDISNVTGEYYVFATASGYYEQSYGKMTINEIFLR